MNGELTDPENLSGLWYRTSWMDRRCTDTVHCRYMWPVHPGCHCSVPSRETVIDAFVTLWSHFRDTANVRNWDIAKKLWGNFE